MTANVCEPRTANRAGSARAVGEEIVELALLLPRDHLSLLERLAEVRGTVTARLLRQVIWDFLVRELRLGPDTEG